MHWTGYMVHISETCDEDSVHLITHVHTTPADVHEAMCTEAIHKALVDKGLPPREHLVDAGYVSAELLVRSQVHYGIDLVGPARINATWQTKVEGAYTGRVVYDRLGATRSPLPSGRSIGGLARLQQRRGKAVPPGLLSEDGVPGLPSPSALHSG